MGLLILGLVFGFVFVVGIFYVPVLAVLFAAILAGRMTQSPLKGLIVGAGGATIVAALLGHLPSASNALSTDNAGWPEALIRTLSGIGADSVVGLSIIDTVGGFYSFVIIVLAIVGAVGGLIGGIANRE